MSTMTKEPDEINLKAKGNGKGNGNGAALAADLGLDLGIKGVQCHVMTPKVELSSENLEYTRQYLQSYASFLMDRSDIYVSRMGQLAEAKRRNGDAVTESGEPITFLGYSYWNGFTAGPFQLFTDPPWRPGKIIAAGELALVVGAVFVNPAPDPGGGIPGTVALSGRDFRVRLETINLTTVTNGPDFTFAGNFGAFPAVLNLFLGFFVPGNPGANPWLFETNLTADITDPGQPFAIIGENHVDFDTEPAFLFIPGTGPEIQHDRSMRYLIYNPV